MPINVLIIDLVNRAFQIYTILLIARILMSWVNLPDNPTVNIVVRFIKDVTEPYLGIFRRILPMASMGGAGIDFSPIIAFFVLSYLIQPVVLGVLRQILFG